MGSIHRSVLYRKTSDSVRFIITTIFGVAFGFFIGISFPSVSLTKFQLSSGLISSHDAKGHSRSISNSQTRIYVPTNPHGAELLPPNIVVSESDFYLRRLWGEPSEDLQKKPKYLVTFTVGYDQRNTIAACVKKVIWANLLLSYFIDSKNRCNNLYYHGYLLLSSCTCGSFLMISQFCFFTMMVGLVNGTNLSGQKEQSMSVWYAKRFLHPDIIAAYEYIFIWDEDLGVEHFDAEKYIELVRKHGLEISQPALEPNNGLTWQMTKRRGDREVHKDTEEKPGWCSDPRLPPCAAFVEIMAPVFSREAWRCVWHMIQNDLVHGWGLDFALRRCVEPAHEKIGVIDSQWIIHQIVPSLGNQGEPENGKAPWEGVRARCRNEWSMFQNRLAEADQAYASQTSKE
ncbi:hypothetical protein MANES_04G019500v8 [Manihot esculenta]|uniref:Uncharacterized protein n=1 Tax=Manihot esculenta TaxID=3983 RepID=A0ACB7HR22_MANES|nr:hypothetical protein MANES_04G019500v8 [Manihot esculenta]